MRADVLLDDATRLLRQALRFEHPVHVQLSRYFHQHRRLGRNERAALAQTLDAVLRRKLHFEYLAARLNELQNLIAPMERRLALLALPLPDAVLQAAVTPDEKRWLELRDGLDTSHWPAACQHNLPDWLALNLQRQMPLAEFDAAAESLLQTAALGLRVNIMQGKRQTLADELKADGILAESTPYSPWGLRLQGRPALHRHPAFLRGAFEIQDEGSQLIALLTGAKRGEMVMDFCAGAGGKTLALGAMMRSRGMLYALDTAGHRLQALQPRLQRSGLNHVHVLTLASEEDPRLARLAGKMDRVLVDAPCSGLGTLRRSPDLKWRQTEAQVLAMAGRQTAILRHAARLLKPGGRLVYATCSLLQQENEDVAQQFAQTHAAFQPLQVSSLLAQLKIPAASSLCSPDGLYLRLWPHRHASDGFFAAVWQRCN